jgi:hypothetical protein
MSENFQYDVSLSHSSMDKKVVRAFAKRLRTDEGRFALPRIAEHEKSANLRCQIGISSLGHGGRHRSRPHIFTEQGVAMFSSVLRSERAKF